MKAPQVKVEEVLTISAATKKQRDEFEVKILPADLRFRSKQKAQRVRAAMERAMRKALAA